jgi:hypothetical protein
MVLPPDEENETAMVVCEAALVTRIASKEEGMVSLHVFPEASRILETTGVAHRVTPEDGTWHFISECPTGS